MGLLSTLRQAVQTILDIISPWLDVLKRRYSDTSARKGWEVGGRVLTHVGSGDVKIFCTFWVIEFHKSTYEFFVDSVKFMSQIPFLHVSSLIKLEGMVRSKAAWYDPTTNRIQ